MSAKQNNFDMTVSYKSDFTPYYNNLYLIINHLSNWYYTKYPENLWKIILPVKLGLDFDVKSYVGNEQNHAQKNVYINLRSA